MQIQKQRNVEGAVQNRYTSGSFSQQPFATNLAPWSFSRPAIFFLFFLGNKKTEKGILELQHDSFWDQPPRQKKPSTQMQVLTIVNSVLGELDQPGLVG